MGAQSGRLYATLFPILLLILSDVIASYPRLVHPWVPGHRANQLGGIGRCNYAPPGFWLHIVSRLSVHVPDLC